MSSSDLTHPALVPKGSGAALRARLWQAANLTNLILALCALLTAWLVFVPLAALFYTAFAEDTPYGPGAFTLDNAISVLTDRHLGELLSTSFLFAGGAAVLTLVLGFAVAWVVERTDAPGRGWFHAFALLSFALPGLLITMAWILIFSPNIGWLNGELKSWFGLAEAPVNIFSLGGMIWALSSHYFPLVYLLMSPALRVLDTRMEEAATMAGASSRQLAMRISMPLLRPAILSVLLLMFIRGIESFEVPRLLGLPSRVFVLTTEIQGETGNTPPEFGMAAAHGVMLLLICVIGVYLYRQSTRNAEAFATITGKGYRPTRIRLGAWRWPVFAAVALMFAVTLGLPFFTLVWQSFFRNVTLPAWSAVPAMSLDGYRTILSYPIFLGAVANSVVLGAGAATIVVLFTFVMAWIAQRAARTYGWALDALAFVPIAIPSVIIGASILFAYLIIPIPVYNTLWILLIAYVTMNLPYGMRFSSSGILQIHKELEEAAAMSGAGLLRVFGRVLLPLLAPVLIAAWLYIFVLAVRELSASIFLAGPGTHVLGTISLTMWEDGGSFGTISALGVVQIVPLIAIVLAMRWIEQRMAERR
jgi:iron(III) transport system permease protein